ncbi:hypothetical protein EROM_010700 [Encephalitozoon romaleae SJ-2008]|uniref:Uncharacterized protein n=1 Tax=Encephalitozoon romaleae (strain SJ-2008) TaxID=1178016 RepID=I7AL83_ENCRO|nr:hypothetical protein EROM_010700 [Encephalitozoon romaleae SJ-2008]AFN82414.1 hypothetical protein EROM_010700 [Encephalitozoon romaleae SJ-2008]
MDSPDGRSGSSISLRKLGMIVAIFFFAMATGLMFIYRHLNNKDNRMSRPGPQGKFGVSLKRGGSESSPSGNERISLLSMDADHVKKLFNMFFEDIKNGREAYSDILRFLERHEKDPGLSSGTRGFIKTAISFLEGTSESKTGSSDIEVLMALVDVIAKRLPKK